MSGRSKLLSEVGSMSSKVACTPVWLGYQTQSAFLAQAPIANFGRWTNWKFSKFCPRTYSSPFFLLPITSACRWLLRRFPNVSIDRWPIEKSDCLRHMLYAQNLWSHIVTTTLTSGSWILDKKDNAYVCQHQQRPAQRGSYLKIGVMKDRVSLDVSK